MTRLILALSAFLMTTPAFGADRTVVLELFTSQGCSSCPPADALLQELAREPGVLALSRPVDYWDRLGWRDTLARPENTDKQRAYARAMSDSERVYTPQIVVDGSSETVGSDETSVRELITAARGRASPVTISAEAAEDGAWRVTAGGSPDADVHLIGYLPSAHVVIAAGENEGAEIDYSNAVRTDVILGKADGGALTTPDLRTLGEVRWAIVIQTGAAGPIGGALALADR